jgi:hypothetical protein
MNLLQIPMKKKKPIPSCRPKRRDISAVESNRFPFTTPEESRLDRKKKSK